MLPVFSPSLSMDPQNPFSLQGMNQWTLLSFALFGFIAGYAVHGTMGATVPGSSGIAANQRIAPPSPPGAPPTVQPPAAAVAANPPKEDDDAVLGKKDAKVTLIEFTDYQCPFCGRHFTQTFGQIKKEYVDTGKVKYIVRDFPLSIHPNAPKAAEATECAHAQGKFWEMHETIFSKQSLWSSAPSATDLFKQYASDLGLDGAKFATCLDSGKFTAETQKDFADGSASGVTGTPAFFINGKKLSGAQPFAAFKAAIDAELGG